MGTQKKSDTEFRNVQLPGNRKRQVTIRTQPASGNRCKVWGRMNHQNLGKVFQKLQTGIGNHRDFIKHWELEL